MSHSALDIGHIPTLNYIITHVFCPLQLPHEDDHTTYNNHSLVGAVAIAARLYTVHVNQANTPQWRVVSTMLENLQDTVRSKNLDNVQIISQLNGMDIGGKLSNLQSPRN